MNIPKEAIEKAISGGYTRANFFPYDEVGLHDALPLSQMYSPHVALDPSFWQGLGIGLGNKEEMRCDSRKCDTVRCEWAGYKNPHKMYENFCDLIWRDGDTDAFWEELLDSKN